MSEDVARLHAVVYGRVQGVNFRYYTQKEAQILGLAGWVANRRDGTVETVAEGERSALEKFLAFLHQGPVSARVDKVQFNWSQDRGEFSHFQVRYM